MRAVKRTPRSEMQMKALWRKAEGIAAELALALEAPADVVESEFNTFVYLSANVEFDNGEAGWEPATAIDDEAVIVAKFLKYMEADIEPTNRAAALVQERDRPYDEALAPAPPDAKQKKTKR